MTISHAHLEVPRHLVLLPAAHTSNSHSHKARNTLHFNTLTRTLPLLPMLSLGKFLWGQYRLLLILAFS